MTNVKQFVNQYTLIAVCINATGVLLGLLFADNRIDTSHLSKNPEAVVPDFTLVSIVLNNVSVLLTEITGAVFLGVPTALSLLFSGIPLGMMLAAGDPVYLLLPHMILEFPALWLAGSVGLQILHMFAKYLREKRAVILTDEEIRQAGEASVVAVLLMMLAGFVEVYVTLPVAEFLR